MRQRSENLDLVRATAISMVVLYHVVQQMPSRPEIVYRLVSGGRYGVHLFFVLSGFLIGGLYWSELGAWGHVQPLRFIARRALRTMPPYFVALAIAFGAVHFWRGEPFDVRYLFFAQNYAPMPFFLVSWSLCIEEHFYIALPLLFHLVHPKLRSFAPLLLFGAFALSVVLRCVYAPGIGADDFSPRYTATHLRLDGLAVGVFAAWLTWRYGEAPARFLTPFRIPLFVTVVMIVLASFWIPAPLMYSAGEASLTLLFGALILIGAAAGPWPLAAARTTATIAAASYSIYLTHSLMIAATGVVAERLHLPAALFALAALLILTSVGVAFHRLVETPSIVLRDRLVARRGRVTPVID